MLLLISLVSSGCVGIIPPISTKLTDAQSGEPIAGAVVLLNWTTSSFGYEPTTSDYRSFEAISNNNGVVNLPGMDDAGVGYPDIFIYKRGYVGWQTQSIFPENSKRHNFGWYNGYTFKLERFERGLSVKDHQRFIHSPYLPYKTNDELYRKAINGNSLIRRIKKREPGWNSSEAQRRRFNERLPSRDSRIMKNQNLELRDDEIRQLIKGIYDLCSNQRSPLIALAQVAPENPIIKTYLPDAMDVVVDQWLYPGKYIGNTDQSRIDCARKRDDGFPKEAHQLDTGSSSSSEQLATHPMRHYVTANDIGGIGAIVVPILQRALVNADGWVRRNIILALAYTGSSSVSDMLIEEYNHRSDTMQVVIQAMGMLGEARFVPMIVMELDNEDKGTAEDAANALRRISLDNPKIMKNFVPGLQHRNKDLRETSFKHLAYYIQPHHEETIAELLKQLSAANPETRQQVVEILGAILNNDEVVPALIRATKDSNGSVQKSAVTALGFKSGSLVHDALVEIYTGSNDALRYLAGRSLLDIGVPMDELLNLYEYNH